MVEPSLKENWERREEKADGNSKCEIKAKLTRYSTYFNILFKVC